MERSYLNLDRRDGQLGIQLVNSDGDTYFLYDKPLLSMWENSDRYVLVKHRNRDARGAIAYHAGQVLGALEPSGEDVQIHLYLGPVGHDLGYDVSNKKLKNVISQQVYTIPADELEAIVKAFVVVRRNGPYFNEMMAMGRTLALYEK